MTIRTTIVIPEATRERLRRLAAERRQSMGEIIREAIEEKLSKQRPKPKSFGMGASDGSGIARRIDELYEPDRWRS
jgi:hypothetical protein